MQALFDSASFAPHGYCLFWDPTLIALHVVADLMIFASYFAIPGALVLFLRRRPELRFRGLISLFAAFILLCGLTHLVSLATLWLPVYAAEGALKLVTGAISATTAVVLFGLVPRLVAIPSPHDLEAANRQLRAEIAAHEETLARLREAQRTLEARVEERTRDLTAATQQLSVLSREAVHRSRNLLTVVSSIAKQTVRNAPDLDGFLDRFLGRINALATATAAVREAAAGAVAMASLVERQLEPVLLTFGARVAVEGPDIDVNPQTAQQLSLVLHELATNSQKHGVLSRGEGEVRLRWAVDQTARSLVLDWREQGGPPADGSKETAAMGGGFGSTLLLRIAPATLGGQAAASFADGFHYRLSVPLDRTLPQAEGTAEAEELARSIVDEAWELPRQQPA